MSVEYLEDLLLRAVQSVDQHNFMELLPMDVIAWYNQRRLESEVDEDSGQNGTNRLLGRFDNGSL